MYISDYAIKRPLSTVVVMVALVVFGAFALWQLKTDEFPDIDQPVVFAAIFYPGASPEQVETEVLEPVEEAILSIAGVDQMMGEARDGYAQIITLFLFDKDPQQATQDIRDAISAIRTDLPQEMEEPILRRFDPVEFPIVQVSVSSTTLSTAELTRLVDPGIVRELRSIPGVAQAQLAGTLERELTIELNPAALQSVRVSVAQVVQAVQFQNLASPVGRVTTALEERTIRLKGRLEAPEDFAQLVVSERNGQLIRLGQVARVYDGTQEQRSLALYNELDAIGVNIIKTRGYSTTDVSEQVRARIDSLRATLPAGVEIELVRDAGVTVSASVKRVQETLLEGALLTVLVVFLFLNSWRSTIITGLALPVSVLASFIAVWAFGFKLETMSLLGLSLAIGILIDDAIVVRENIVRHVRMGKSHFDAAHEGTNEIGLAVTATTLAIVSVFVPVAFMYGVSGQWFKPFALTIACSVLVSLFVSFSLDPMLSAYWPDPHVPEEKKSWITRRLDRFNERFNQMALGYKRVIAWALDHRLPIAVLATWTFIGAMAMPVKGFAGLAGVFVVMGVLVVVLLLFRPRWFLAVPLLAAGFVATIVVIGRVPSLGQVGVSFFPEDDRAEFNIALETPPGSTLEYTRIKTEEVLRAVRRHPEVEYTYATVGGEGGTVDVASAYVRLVPMEDRALSAEDIAQLVRDEAATIAGATVSVFTNNFSWGFKQIQIQLRGANTTALNQAAEAVLAEVRQVDGAVDIGLSSKGQKPELDVQLNRGLAGSLGITVGQVAQALRPAFAGIDVGDWTDPAGQTRDVTVRLSPETRRSPSDLARLPIVVNGPDGRPTTLPLGQVASIRQSSGPARITHLDGDKVVTVEANTKGRSSGEILADIRTRIAALDLPPGVRVTEGGEAQDQAEVFGAMAKALGVALILMYLILVMQFGSFMDPLAILVSLPLSMIGVMLALGITGKTINIMSLIGVILLMGIVAKNAILLIDFAKWARERSGMPLRDALIEAGAVRLRPILMTTFALTAGMVPVALGGGDGGQFRAPLGIAVIGGVLTSTLLTLVAIPTFYEIMDDTRAKLAMIFGFRVRQQTAEHRMPAASAVGQGD